MSSEESQMKEQEMYMATLQVLYLIKKLGGTIDDNLRHVDLQHVKSAFSKAINYLRISV